MKPRTRRLAWIVTGLAVLGVAAALVLNAFQSNLVFFFTPTQVAAHEAPQGRPFRIGGLVESGSLAREPNSLTVHFRVTDTAQTIPSATPGFCRICSKRAEASWRRELSARTVRFMPARFWPSTTKTTCHRRLPMRSSRRTRRW